MTYCCIWCAQIRETADMSKKLTKYTKEIHFKIVEISLSPASFSRRKEQKSYRLVIKYLFCFLLNLLRLSLFPGSFIREVKGQRVLFCFYVYWIYDFYRTFFYLSFEFLFRNYLFCAVFSFTRSVEVVSIKVVFGLTNRIKVK